MQTTSISDALFTRTQQRVLGLLFGYAERSFYTNEIMRHVAMGRGTVSRELDKLVYSLRAQGERVVSALPGQKGDARAMQCDREIVKQGNEWVVKQI